MSVSTVKAVLNSVRICQVNGWGAGAILEGEPLPKEQGQQPRRIRIVEVDAKLGLLLASELFADGTEDEVKSWSLKAREWRKIDGQS